MAIYAIADLHLSFSTDKPMDIFGENWTDHAEQIKKNWIDKVSVEDLVLVPGDISWALHFKDSFPDLQWLSNLPGTIAIIRGNHDYWWSTLTKMRQAFPNLNFLQNNCLVHGETVISGTRGWICPGTQGFDAAQDSKIYLRELNRMKLSLDEARKTGISDVMVMVHFPPFSDRSPDRGFEHLFQEYGVKKVLFGHIHNQFDGVVEGAFNGVEYRLVSSDFIQFDPVRIQD